MDSNCKSLNSKSKVSIHTKYGKIIWTLLQVTYVILMFLPYLIFSVWCHFLKKSKSITGHVVLVTGAGGALGRELCLEVAKRGCKVACADINDEETEITVSQIKNKFPQTLAVAYHCDVSSTEDIRNLYNAISRDLGKVDILINNAGILRRGFVHTVIDEKLDKILNINLKSHFLIIRQFLPDMLQQNRGHIVAIASMSAISAIPNAAEYSCTKHAVLGMMESLYYDLKAIPNNKVRTTCVCPYFFITKVVNEKNLKMKIKPLTAEEVAKSTVDAICKNKVVISVPGAMYYTFSLSRFLPQNYIDLIRSVLITKIPASKR